MSANPPVSPSPRPPRSLLSSAPFWARPWFGWGLAALAVVAGFLSYGWPGLVLAITVVVFWLLLQFSRALRVLRNAGANPVGLVPNAVMLASRLQPGMRLPQVLAHSKCLGHKVEGPGEENFAWADAAGDRVLVVFSAGRLMQAVLQRGGGAP